VEARPEDRAKFIAWYETPEKKRRPRFASQWGIDNNVPKATVSSWVKKYKKAHLIEGSLVDDNFDIKDFLATHRKDVVKALMTSVKKGNSKGIETSLKLLGELTEKKEETKKFELSASEYIAIGRKVVERFRADYEKSGGNCPLCHRPKVSGNELCVDAKPEQSESGEMATVAVPA
jgi:hypothetical protein